MGFPIRARLAVVALAGIAAGAAAWHGIAPIPPFLDVLAATDGNSAWTVTVVARGDETIEGIRVAIEAGPARIAGADSVASLARGARTTFRVERSADAPAGDRRVVARVTQTGPVSGTHDLVLPEHP